MTLNVSSGIRDRNAKKKDVQEANERIADSARIYCEGYKSGFVDAMRHAIEHCYEHMGQKPEDVANAIKAHIWRKYGLEDPQ